jgi:hypothetical protein
MKKAKAIFERLPRCAKKDDKEAFDNLDPFMKGNPLFWFTSISF